MKIWETTLGSALCILVSVSIILAIGGRPGEALLLFLGSSVGILVIFLLGYLLEGRRSEMHDLIFILWPPVLSEKAKKPLVQVGIILIVACSLGLFTSFTYSSPSPVAFSRLWLGYSITVGSMLILLATVFLIAWSYFKTNLRGLLLILPFFHFTLLWPLIERTVLPTQVEAWNSWQIQISILASALKFAMLMILFLGIGDVVSSTRRAVPVQPLGYSKRRILVGLVLLVVSTSLIATSWGVAHYFVQDVTLWSQSMLNNIVTHVRDIDTGGYGGGSSGKAPAEWWVQLQPHQQGMRITLSAKKHGIWTRRQTTIHMENIRLEKTLRTPILGGGSGYEFHITRGNANEIEEYGGRVTVYLTLMGHQPK